MNDRDYKVQYLRAFKDNYIWLLLNNSLTKAIVIDPGESAALIKFLDENKIALEAVWITHHHADHCGGIDELKNKYPIKVYGPKNEKIKGIDFTLDENDILNSSFTSDSFKILTIPGHTSGHIAFYSSEVLFCGDTLFSAGCGRLFEGTAEQMHHSLKKIKALSDHTLVYCAHEYTLKNLLFAQMAEPSNEAIAIKITKVQELLAKHCPSLPTSLAEEKMINPFLRCHVKEIIHTLEKHFNIVLTSEVEVFKYLRLWKDNF